MNKHEILQQLEQAAREEAIGLDLSTHQLTELPGEIGNLTDLRTLDLRGNQLAELPNEIGLLANLRSLDVSNNRLTRLPVEIGFLTNLRSLDISHNQLAGLPGDIGLLTNLLALQVHGNQLTELPGEVCNLTVLRFLNLADNRLTELPSEIGNLTRLGVLDLRQNQLPIPAEILSQMHSPFVILKYYLDHQLPSINQRLCFVLMPFADTNNLPEVWEDVIQGAVFGETGMGDKYRCLRADDIYDNSSIIDDIVRHIQEADVIIADLTMRNPNVMYELGRADEMGKECILITQSITDIPFDLTHRRVISYSTTTRGLTRLKGDLVRTLTTISDRLDSRPS